MALPLSGPISLNDVNVELGFSGTASINMGSADVRGLFGVASGAISMSDGYGKASGPAVAPIAAPTRNTQTASYFGFAYLQDPGDGNGDVMFSGGVYGPDMHYMQFGTNNRLSTWSTSGQPQMATMPSQRYTNNRTFTATGIAGTRNFVVATENWLGYTTGMAVSVYKMDGSGTAPVQISGWTQLFGDQTSTQGVWMDPLNPGNGVVLNDYTHNYPNYSNIWAFPFKVNAAGTSISGQGAFQLSNNAGGVKSAVYSGGRLVVRSNSADGRQNYVYSCLFNTSTGGIASGPTQNGPPGGTQSYGWDRERAVPEIFRLSDGTWLLAYRDDSGGVYRLMLTRMAFSGNSITFSNTVDTGLSVNSDSFAYMIGQETATSDVDSIYLSGQKRSNSVYVGQKWTWTGSALSNVYEEPAGTITSAITNGLPFIGGNMSERGGIPRYTPDDNVWLASSPSSYTAAAQIMPYYWKHK